jgi:hypothetical protein
MKKDGQQLMGVSEKEEKRKVVRFFLQLKARYSVEGEKVNWGECIIMNTSRKGMCIKFLTRDKIIIGSKVHLKIAIPGEFKPPSVTGVLIWMGKEEDHFIGGIELAEELDEIKWAKLTKID